MYFSRKRKFSNDYAAFSLKRKIAEHPCTEIAGVISRILRFAVSRARLRSRTSTRTHARTREKERREILRYTTRRVSARGATSTGVDQPGDTYGPPGVPVNFGSLSPVPRAPLGQVAFQIRFLALLCSRFLRRSHLPVLSRAGESSINDVHD